MEPKKYLYAACIERNIIMASFFSKQEMLTGSNIFRGAKAIFIVLFIAQNIVKSLCHGV